jgi:hypothetical protein
MCCMQYSYVMALSETEVLGFTTDMTLLVWRADPG